VPQCSSLPQTLAVPLRSESSSAIAQLQPRDTQRAIIPVFKRRYLGRLLNTSHIIISNFAAGDAKSFSGDFLKTVAMNIDWYKIQFENGV